MGGCLAPNLYICLPEFELVGARWYVSRTKYGPPIGQSAGHARAARANDDVIIGDEADVCSSFHQLIKNL